MTEIWLDDLYPGYEFRTGEHQLTTTEIIDFARQFDPQPFHTDPSKATNLCFEGLAASGWHTAALTMRLYVEAITFGRGSVGLEVNLRWPSPTRPGDVLHVEGRITDVRRSQSKPDRGIISIEYETVNQDGEVRQSTTAKVMVFARPPDCLDEPKISSAGEKDLRCRRD